METYADRIDTVTVENGEKLTEKIKRFYLELKNGSKYIWKKCKNT